MTKKIAVFLDRDGTINDDIGYLSNPDQLNIFSEVPSAIKLINDSGLLAIVITNQSGIARGYFDEACVYSIHARINEILAETNARIDRFYFCPHHPTEGNPEYVKICSCRKPNPGMLLKAAEELDIDLHRSYMVGDMPKDIEAARNVGAKGILVRTGNRESNLQTAAGAAYIADHVLAAVKWILQDVKS